MKKDKGRDAVVLDRKKYFEKCINLSSTDQVTKISNHPKRIRSCSYEAG